MFFKTMCCTSYSPFENQNDVVENYVSENHMTGRYGWQGGSRKVSKQGITILFGG